jgi:DNA-binding NarL/FixJ family response regulator
VVTLLVPVPPQEPTPAAPEPERDPDALRVLVVDDHPIVREGLVGVIASVPCMRVVAQAGDGDSAIARACETEPDIVLMDLKMPGMSGIEATRLLKRRLPATYVIALSMSDDAATADAARAAGADEFVSKAVDISEVLERVRARLRGGDQAHTG